MPKSRHSDRNGSRCGSGGCAPRSAISTRKPPTSLPTTPGQRSWLSNALSTHSHSLSNSPVSVGLKGTGHARTGGTQDALRRALPHHRRDGRDPACVSHIPAPTVELVEQRALRRYLRAGSLQSYPLRKATLAREQPVGAVQRREAEHHRHRERHLRRLRRPARRVRGKPGCSSLDQVPDGTDEAKAVTRRRRLPRQRELRT